MKNRKILMQKGLKSLKILSTGDKTKGLNAFMRNRLRIIRVNLLRFSGLSFQVGYYKAIKK